MLRNIVLIFAVLGMFFGANAQGQTEALLKRAKAEAKYLYQPRIQPKKASDDEKYVTIRDASGKQFVDRGKIALDLLEQAANAGSGEAAYILFCYNWLGRYDGHICYAMPSWDQYAESAMEKCDADLQRAADLQYAKALEFVNLKNEISPKSRTDLYEGFIQLYDALEGDPKSQMWLALRYKNTNPQKYEYWIKQSISHKDWPLLARADYALYLLDGGRRDEALAVIKPTEKKTDYYSDTTASSGIKKMMLFYIADHLYSGKIANAMTNCDNLYKESADYIRRSYDKGVFDGFVESHDYNYLEGCVDYYTGADHKRLLETIYDLNKNPEDRTILHHRGQKYEIFGDSANAFDYYKAAAMKQHCRAIMKTLDYATKGYKLSDSEIDQLTSSIITSDNNENGSFQIAGDLANWKTYYILAEYFYHSDRKDYPKAVVLYNECANAYDCPQIIKGQCARQLFKCYEFGRGVEVDHDRADKWIGYAKRIGDIDAGKISEILYQ